MYLKCSPKVVFGATAGPSIFYKIVKSRLQTLLRKKLEKIAQKVLTQPLKTLKSIVWFKRNHSFQLSSVAATWLEKCPQVALIWDTSATKALKNTSQDCSKNQ